MIGIKLFIKILEYLGINFFKVYCKFFKVFIFKVYIVIKYNVVYFESFNLI